LVGAERRDRTRVGRRLSDDHVARVDQRLAHQVDDLLAAGGDEDVLRVDVGALGGHDVADRVLGDRQALGRPVLQRGRCRGGGYARHDRREVLGREGRRVGQAARQRDDLGALGDGHEVAHRRGLHAARP
jgi:hypothetical protein